MNRKDAVTELVFLGQAEILHFADGLSTAERRVSGTNQDWAPRDVLAHMIFWKLRLAQNLAAAQRGEAVQPAEDIQLENTRTFKRYRRASWEQVMAMVEAAQAEILTQVEALSESDLDDPHRFPWMDGRPAWRAIVGDCHLHPLSHLGPLYVKRGQPEAAMHMWEASSDLLAGLDDAPAWQGVIAYDRACGYALSGQPEQALEHLAVALRAHPDLAAWAAQDSDLNGLHALPEFQALVAGAAEA
jgi:tetratricopeptide (TPR) repeat protein